MKHKTLFRLMLKLVGVWLCVSGAGSLLSVTASLLYSWFQPSQSVLPGAMFPFYFGGPLVQLAAGVYLFIGGRWIADRAIPSNRPYCHECGYELTGIASDICPECGTAFRNAAVAGNA